MLGSDLSTMVVFNDSCVCGRQYFVGKSLTIVVFVNYSKKLQGHGVGDDRVFGRFGEKRFGEISSLCRQLVVLWVTVPFPMGAPNMALMWEGLLSAHRASCNLWEVVWLMKLPADSGVDHGWKIENLVWEQDLDHNSKWRKSNSVLLTARGRLCSWPQGCFSVLIERGVCYIGELCVYDQNISPFSKVQMRVYGFRWLRWRPWFRWSISKSQASSISTFSFKPCLYTTFRADSFHTLSAASMWNSRAYSAAHLFPCLRDNKFSLTSLPTGALPCPHFLVK